MNKITLIINIDFEENQIVITSSEDTLTTTIAHCSPGVKNLSNIIATYIDDVEKKHEQEEVEEVENISLEPIIEDAVNKRLIAMGIDPTVLNEKEK